MIDAMINIENSPKDMTQRQGVILVQTIEIVSAMLAAGQLNASKPEGDALIVAGALKTIFTTLDEITTK